MIETHHYILFHSHLVSFVLPHSGCNMIETHHYILFHSHLVSFVLSHIKAIIVLQFINNNICSFFLTLDVGSCKGLPLPSYLLKVDL